ncbi:MAG: hypothetical protein ABSE64_00450 [Vulcanimicrobiaceae bacterium]
MLTFLTFLMGFAAFATAIASVQALPMIPSWIHSGLTLTYSGDAAYSQSNGEFSRTKPITINTRVDAVADNAIVSLSQVFVGGTPQITESISWSCNTAGVCRARKGEHTQIPVLSDTGFNVKFWVDPTNPISSEGRVYGKAVALVGNGVYTLRGHKWRAMTISWQDPMTGGKSVMVFDTRTGLMLAYFENSAFEVVHEYFQSMQ